MIAEHTAGVTSVLYLAAGFDLNNVLTTFPDATEVVMIGKNYHEINANELITTMTNETLSEEALRYQDVVIANGFGLTITVEKPQYQIAILAIELMSLGVDPGSITGHTNGNGIRFSLPQKEGGDRSVSVEFRNEKLGPTSRSQQVADKLEFEDHRVFDGVFFKAGEQLAGVLSVMLEQVAGALNQHPVLVLNNLHRDIPSTHPARSSRVEVPGFQTTYVRSYWTEDTSYGNRLNVYKLNKLLKRDKRIRDEIISSGFPLSFLLFLPQEAGWWRPRCWDYRGSRGPRR